MRYATSQLTDHPGDWLRLTLAWLVLAVAWSLTPANAQDDYAPGDPAGFYSGDDLQALVGPIALYPDELVGIILPAAAYPVQVVQAARYLEDVAADPGLAPDPTWDDAVVALLNYPELLRLMSDNLAWTERLGEAVVLQQDQVLAAIQTFRGRAVAAGNLRSDERQIVTEDDGQITIAPADPSVVYLPRYEPRTVLVYQTVPAWGYFPRPYPVYYYPYPAGFSFGVFGPQPFWGVSTAFMVGWRNFALNVYYPDYFAHPFYGWSYYRPFYSRYYVDVGVRYADYRWQPRGRWHNDSYRRYTTQREQTRRVASRDGYARDGARVATADRRARIATSAERAGSNPRDAAARRSRPAQVAPTRAPVSAAEARRAAAVREGRARLPPAARTERTVRNGEVRRAPSNAQRPVVRGNDTAGRVTARTRTGSTAQLTGQSSRPTFAPAPRERRSAIAGSAGNAAGARQAPARSTAGVPRTERSAPRSTPRSTFAPATRNAPRATAPPPRPRAEAPRPRSSTGGARQSYGGRAPARAESAPRGGGNRAAPGNGSGRSGTFGSGQRSTSGGRAR